MAFQLTYGAFLRFFFTMAKAATSFTMAINATYPK
jgi:hypothetical protein